MKSIKTALFGVFAAFILSACGGGGGGNTPTVLIPVNPPAVNPPTDNPPADNPPAENFNTAEFRGNYGLASIRADSAYKARAFGQGVTVAVMDSGILTSHIDLRDNIVAGRDFAFNNGQGSDVIDDPEGHGTAVAGVIGARRGNGGVHGVASSVRIMPLQIGDESGNFQHQYAISAINYGINRDAKIINASFGGAGRDYVYGEYQGNRYWFEIPGLVAHTNNDYTDYANSFADAVRGEDVVVVWAAGNSGFHPGGRKVIYRANCNDITNSECIDTNIGTRISDAQIANFRVITHTDRFGDLRSGGYALSELSLTVTSLNSFESELPFWTVDNIRQLLDDRRDGTITEQQLNDAVLADPDFVSTAQRWLAVVAVDENNRIASFSNGCGPAIVWCIAAPGVNISTTAAGNNGQRGNNRYDTVDGTSFAAPHVSGALALLKSAAPEIPMTVVWQILLTTATDLGDDGVDPVYGWGLVNVDAGIEHIANLETANGLAYSDLRESLPSEFSHLRGRLSDVSVALKITDDSYYNIPLSDIVGGDSQKTKLGNAAKEMQADDFTAGESFRFWGGLEYDGSRSSYIGESGGIFSAENASDTGGYVKWTTADYAGLSAFGEYGRTQIKADYDSASFISQIQNARAEEWAAGFQYQNLFLHNDNLQFSARQESRISGGEMVLHYPVADGDSHKAFIGESVQTIRTETARIPIKQKPQTIYTAGYSQKTENSKWSAAAEWNAATNAKGVSFAIELQIR